MVGGQLGKNPCVATVSLFNRTVAQAKKPSVVVLTPISDPRLVVFSDSGHGILADGGSQSGLVAGFALDLTTCDELGQAWDFAKPERRAPEQLPACHHQFRFVKQVVHHHSFQINKPKEPSRLLAQ